MSFNPQNRRQLKENASKCYHANVSFASICVKLEQHIIILILTWPLDGVNTMLLIAERVCECVCKRVCN